MPLKDGKCIPLAYLINELSELKPSFTYGFIPFINKSYFQSLESHSSNRRLHCGLWSQTSEADPVPTAHSLTQSPTHSRCDLGQGTAHRPHPISEAPGVQCVFELTGDREHGLTHSSSLGPGTDPITHPIHRSAAKPVRGPARCDTLRKSLTSLWLRACSPNPSGQTLSVNEFKKPPKQTNKKTLSVFRFFWILELKIRVPRPTTLSLS